MTKFIRQALANKGYFERFAAKIAANGFEIIEIELGRKFTTRKGWEAAGLSKDQIGKFIADGKGAYGVGILTRHTPLIDIDCYDEDVVNHMVEFINSLCGLGSCRIGMAPKRGYLYRCDGSFPKINSAVFSHDGKDHRLEVLGDGQQFVAAAIHPDTQKPYKWPDGNSPARIEVYELPALTQGQGRFVAAEFERLATTLGWQLKTKSLRLANGGRKLAGSADQGAASPFDKDFIDVKSTCGLTIDQVREALFKLPNDGFEGEQDYDTWANVGMAVYHETEGSDEGFALWDEWSNQSGKNETKGTKNRNKWRSFDINGKSREPITFRYVLKLTQDAADAAVEETVRDLRQAVAGATTLVELTDAMKAFKRVNLASLPLIQESVIAEIRRTFKRLEATPISVVKVKELIKYESRERSNAPKWLEPYCYLSVPETFLNRDTGIQLRVRGFDATFSREMLTKRDRLEGKAVPDILPSAFALNQVVIPTYVDARYMPGLDEDFWFENSHYANTYSTKHIPAIPTKLTTADRDAVHRVEMHFNLLIPNERDRTLVLDWLAYIAQTSKRPNWSVMLQGEEGGGKSWLRDLMNEVLGRGNVRPVDAARLNDQHNGWAEGSQLLVLEEVRLAHATAREVMDKIKPLITNSVIQVRRMRTDAYSAPNTAAVLILTNYRDALQLTAGDTRYFPVFGRFADVAQREAFFTKPSDDWASEKDYFTKLYQAVEQHPGAVRQWLLERRLSDEFSGQSRAPVSSVKMQMVSLAKSQLHEAVDLIREEHPFHVDLSDRLMNATKLVELLQDCGEVGDALPSTKAIARLLTSLGFSYLGRLTVDRIKSRFWSKHPEAFAEPPFDDIRIVLATQL